MLLDEGPEVHVGHFVLVYVVGQHPQLLAVPLHYREDVFFLTDYFVSGCRYGHFPDVV